MSAGRRSALPTGAGGKIAVSGGGVLPICCAKETGVRAEKKAIDLSELALGGHRDRSSAAHDDEPRQRRRRSSAETVIPDGQVSEYGLFEWGGVSRLYVDWPG